ncbi:hypothetical protein C8Q76DRAFT_824685 [Earliella scabrosa]|nr:hypothetical protein C8Q76DRAFT_824685 [Earliella scabrosa]
MMEVIKHVKTVLEDMGINITVEREYEYRCIRPTRSETGSTQPKDSETLTPTASPFGVNVIYGDVLQDYGDKVRFEVEST